MKSKDKNTLQIGLIALFSEKIGKKVIVNTIIKESCSYG